MVSANDEKKLIKIFFYASVVSLMLHAGVFLLVVKIGKTWGWIPFDKSVLEVSIVSLMEEPAGIHPADHPSDPQANTPYIKPVQKKKKPAQPQLSAKTEKTPENDLPEPKANHLPGDTSPVETDMAMHSNPSFASEGDVFQAGAETTDGGGSNNHNLNSSGEGGPGVFSSKMNYLDMVRVKIENQKKYPDAAQQRNIQGQVIVEFEISLDGRINEPSVSKSSGHASLDLAAIDAVKKASPFSSPPREYFNDVIHINLPIRFALIR
jgi:TonB family protein